MAGTPIRVLITGAAGQLGQALVATAPAEGVELLALDRAALDLTDRDRVALLVSEASPDWVINAAAYNDVDGAESDPDAAYAVNLHGVSALADACRAIDARLLQVSTDFVFDGRNHEPYGVDTAADPLSVYGKSKLAGEDAALGRLGARALIVRTAWLYEAGHDNFVSKVLARMRRGDTLRVVADQVGTPTWAPPLAQALWSAVASGLEGRHHWTPAGSASRYDLAVAVQEEALACGLLDAPVHIEPISSTSLDSPAERPAYSVLDKSSTWAALGVTPPHWREHLRAMLTQAASVL